jgi:opacity protein-like surface antigen
MHVMKKTLKFLLLISLLALIFLNSAFAIDIVAKGNKTWDGKYYGCDWTNQKKCVITVSEEF